jgi:hypothetical protein
MSDTIEVTFSHLGNKPSRKQVLGKVLTAIRAGASRIEVHWGENCLELDSGIMGTWYGYGWIKEISGQDMANELNRRIINNEN